MPTAYLIRARDFQLPCACTPENSVLQVNRTHQTLPPIAFLWLKAALGENQVRRSGTCAKRSARATTLQLGCSCAKMRTEIGRSLRQATHGQQGGSVCERRAGWQSASCCSLCHQKPQTSRTQNNTVQQVPTRTVIRFIVRISSICHCTAV